MTKMNEALRRADRAVVIAALLIVAMATGAATVGYRPQAEQMPVVTAKPAVHVAAIAPIEAPQAPMAVNAIEARPSAVEVAFVKIAAEQRCLAEAMYYEARGEGMEGQEAIAEVVFHRMHRRGYPASICGVVYQGANDGVSCQFSFVCTGEMNHPKTAVAWAEAKLLAARILSGYMPLGDATNGATSFHATDVEPDWSGSLERTVQIGNHVFYRPLARTRAS
jgi:spore germination cell wall hydrolase CwlJ-like protein